MSAEQQDGSLPPMDVSHDASEKSSFWQRPFSRRKVVATGAKAAVAVTGAAIVPEIFVPQLARADQLPAATEAPHFELGFATIQQLMLKDGIALLAVDNEEHNPESGDATQHAFSLTEMDPKTKKQKEYLLAWRKADNWTAATDGNYTWINGPQGLVKRFNTQRFAWEGDAKTGKYEIVTKSIPLKNLDDQDVAQLANQANQWQKDHPTSVAQTPDVNPSTASTSTVTKAQLESELPNTPQTQAILTPMDPELRQRLVDDLKGYDSQNFEDDGKFFNALGEFEGVQLTPDGQVVVSVSVAGEHALPLAPSAGNPCRVYLGQAKVVDVTDPKLLYDLISFAIQKGDPFQMMRNRSGAVMDGPDAATDGKVSQFISLNR